MWIIVLFPLKQNKEGIQQISKEDIGSNFDFLLSFKDAFLINMYGTDSKIVVCCPQKQVIALIEYYSPQNSSLWIQGLISQFFEGHPTDSLIDKIEKNGRLYIMTMRIDNQDE